MADVNKLVFSMIRFLQDQKTSSSLDEDKVESIEVAIQCLESAYDIDTSDEYTVNKYQVQRNLLDIFNTQLGIEEDSDFSTLSLHEATPEEKEEAENLKNKGNDFMKVEKFSDALQCYSDALKLDNKNSVYYCNRAAAFSKLSEHMLAIKDCKKALTINPLYSKAYGRMGIAYTALEDPESAIECYRKALELDPGNQSYQNNLEISEQKFQEMAARDKILVEAAAEEKKARKEREEERLQEEEQHRFEEENRLREERMKARKERAKRLSMRKERACLVAEGKEIPPELIYTGLPAQRYKDDFDSDESRTDLLDDESFQSLMKVINGMKNHKDCWPFLEPVTEDQAPGYHDVIKRPMDLSKIEKKVELREYRTQHHFLSDFRLMFNNCRRFNGVDSDFTACAKTMEKVLKKLLKRFLSDESTDAYYNDDDFTAGGVKSMGVGTERKIRPKRQAGTKALQTVHDALKSDQSSSDDDSYIEPLKKPRRPPDISPSVNSLLLQEMIEFKRKRAEQRAAAQPSPEKPSTTQGIMIMPREEIPTDGVLTSAASREIRWKIDPNNVTLKQTPTFGSNNQTVVRTPGGIAKSLNPEYMGRPYNLNPLGRPPNPSSVGRPPNPNSVGRPPNPNQRGRPPNTVNVVHKKAAGLAPGQKIIKILASAPGSGITAVRQTAESVKVSSDGYLILNGKPTTIKVTHNTKIVIQPQGTLLPQETSSAEAVGTPLGKELIIKKIPTPAGLMPLSDVESGAMLQAVDNSNNVNIPTVANMEAQKGAQITVTAQHSLSPDLRMQNINSNTNRQPGMGIGKPAIQTTGPNSSPADHMEARKRQYDMAQRLLAAKRKQLMENGPINQKMARLDPNSSPTKPSPNYAIEQGKGVNSNVDSVNSLSSNVLQNVNISNDILDSYYSVMNEANAQKPVPNSIANNGQQGATRNTPVNINRLLHSRSVTGIPVTISTPSDISNSDNQNVKTMSLSALTTALARSIAAGNLQLQKESTNVEHTGNRLRGDSNSATANPNQLTIHNVPNLSDSIVYNNSVVIDIDSDGGIDHQTQRVNDQIQLVNQPKTQYPSVCAAVSERIESTVIKHPATISNLLTTDSARIQNQSQITNLTNVQNQFQVSQSDIRPIEALFSAHTSPVVLSPTKSLANNQTISQSFASYSNLSVSPSQSDRQNLFDMFESGNEKSARSFNSDDFGFANLTENEKLPGKHHPSIKGKGMEFKGSPLNTSVMEALKSKLSPGKHPAMPIAAPFMTFQHPDTDSGDSNQEQYLKPTDQTSPLPVFGTIDPRLGIQEQPQGSYINRQTVLGSEPETLKQTKRVSITIADDTLNRNWQRQNSQNHGSVPSKVIVQSLPRVQTLLDSHDNYSAITPHTVESNPLNISQMSPSNTPVLTNQTRTIESIFASRDSNISPLSTADALASYIASNPGQQNLVISGGNQPVQLNSKQTTVKTQNLLNTAEYLGSINVVPSSSASHSVPVIHYQQANDSEQTAVTNSERLQKLEELFLKGFHTVQQSTLQQPIMTQTSASHGSIAAAGQETPNTEQPST